MRRTQDDMCVYIHTHIYAYVYVYMYICIYVDVEYANMRVWVVVCVCHDPAQVCMHVGASVRERIQFVARFVHSVTSSGTPRNVAPEPRPHQRG